QAVADIFGMDPADLNGMDLSGMRPEEITDALWAPILQKYETKEKLIPAEILRRVERDIMLQIVDAQWKDHLYSLDHLKEGIGLRGYGQRDPLVEYKKESWNMFQALTDRIDEEVLRWIFLYQPVSGRDDEAAGGGDGGGTPPPAGGARGAGAARGARGAAAPASAAAGRGRGRGRRPPADRRAGAAPRSGTRRLR